MMSTIETCLEAEATTISLIDQIDDFMDIKSYRKAMDLVTEVKTTLVEECEMVRKFQLDFTESARAERNVLKIWLEDKFDVMNLEDMAFECEELLEKFVDLENLKKDDEVVKTISDNFKIMQHLKFEDGISSLDDSY